MHQMIEQRDEEIRILKEELDHMKVKNENTEQRLRSYMDVLIKNLFKLRQANIQMRNFLLNQPSQKVQKGIQHVCSKIDLHLVVRALNPIINRSKRCAY